MLALALPSIAHIEDRVAVPATIGNINSFHWAISCYSVAAPAGKFMPPACGVDRSLISGLPTFACFYHLIPLGRKPSLHDLCGL
jgi:hypothetical protein